MASSSSTTVKQYDVFSSFHGPDVRKGFLSHLHDHFERNRISKIITFDDQKIERGNTIGPDLHRAIRESRVSIVVLSKNYASSSWCLDELVEILKCKKALGQSVMTIFYDVDPLEVENQKGDFGEAFEETCKNKTDEMKQRWIEALSHVATIPGVHSENWADEVKMIQQITLDVSNKLNVTPSEDLEEMVGLDAHLNKLESLLDVGCNDVKMIGIWGPAGIGKTTIAKALYNKLSTSFQLKCFMEDLKGTYTKGSDYFKFKLDMQSKLLSRMLSDVKVHHLHTLEERLCAQKVLIILDDVDDLEKLLTLAKEVSCFGPGSRIIVTTEDKKILKAHGIHDTYHVEFPSKEEALQILCLSAFGQLSPKDGFEEFANIVAGFCDNLPLGLRVVGKSLREEDKLGWIQEISEIERNICHDKKLGGMKVAYDRLPENFQSLFLHIACFFNNEDYGRVISMLPEKDLDVEFGLKTLVERSLLCKSTDGKIKVYHYLLQKMGKQIVLEESNEPGRRRFLDEAKEICKVLTEETGTDTVTGISLDMTNMGKVTTNKTAFEGMSNLHFLKIYRSMFGEDGRLNIPKDMTSLPPLKLLDWDDYPRTSLPPKYDLTPLVEIRLVRSKLKKLWDGIQDLPNLKSIELTFSYRLKEIPNLSKATNLETLELSGCRRLVELPSSISGLQKLTKLDVRGCEKLKVIPSNINLASLEYVDISHCSQLRKFPEISTNIKTLAAKDTMIEEVPPSIAEWSRLEFLDIGSKRLKRLTHAPPSITSLDLSKSDIEMIPDCVTSLPDLQHLSVEYCPKLKSIPQLSASLESLYANNCVSLKRVCYSFQKATKELSFSNCLKLDEESRRGIIQQSINGYVCLPSKGMPSEFTHKDIRNSVTVPLTPGTFSASSKFKACILIFLGSGPYHRILCNLRSNGGETILSYEEARLSEESPGLSEHMFILHGDLFQKQNRCHVTMSEITFEFSHSNRGDMITECGVQIMNEEVEGSSSEVDIIETEKPMTEAYYRLQRSKAIEIDFNDLMQQGREVNTNETGDGAKMEHSFLVLVCSLYYWFCSFVRQPSLFIIFLRDLGVRGLWNFINECILEDYI